MRFYALVGAIAVSLLVTGCSTSGSPAPAPTETVTSTLPALPPPARGPDSAIDRLDAYSLCAAKLWRIGVNQWETNITPYENAIIERLDDFGWYVAFQRDDPGPDAEANAFFPAHTWARCALDGTMGEVEWLAAGFCVGEQPVDDKTEFTTIEPYDEFDPRAPACPQEGDR